MSAAAFPSSEALAEGETRGRSQERGLRTDPLWGFDDARGSWLVSREGKPIRHAGTLAALVLALSGADAAELDYVPAELAAALGAAGIGVGRPVDKAGSHFTVGANLLRRSSPSSRRTPSCSTASRSWRKRKVAPPWLSRSKERACRHGLQVLRPGLEGCAACGGKGFQNAASPDGERRGTAPLRERGAPSAPTPPSRPLARRESRATPSWRSASALTESLLLRESVGCQLGWAERGPEGRDDRRGARGVRESPAPARDARGRGRGH